MKKNFEDTWSITNKIQGWFNKQCASIWYTLLEYQERENIYGDIFEIGVFEGRSASVLVNFLKKNENMHLLDIYLKKEKIISNLKVDFNFNEKNIFLHKQNSQAIQTTKQIEDSKKKCRWFHIDGYHSKLGLINDLKIAEDFCLPENSILVIDDVWNIQYPHLTEALFLYQNDSFRRFNLCLIAEQKAYLTNRNSSSKFKAYIKNELVSDLEKNAYVTTLYQTENDDETSYYSLRSRINDLKFKGPD